MQLQVERSKHFSNSCAGKTYEKHVVLHKKWKMWVNFHFISADFIGRFNFNLSDFFFDYLLIRIKYEALEIKTFELGLGSRIGDVFSDILKTLIVIVNKFIHWTWSATACTQHKISPYLSCSSTFIATVFPHIVSVETFLFWIWKLEVRASSFLGSM